MRPGVKVRIRRYWRRWFRTVRHNLPEYAFALAILGTVGFVTVLVCGMNLSLGKITGGIAAVGLVGMRKHVPISTK